jgi:hypothetical protein
MYHRTISFLLVFISICRLQTDAFHVALPTSDRRQPRHGLILSMGKGLGSKARNKQAALREKMEAAKRQNQEEQGFAGLRVSDDERNLTDTEIRERNDRLRFEELLKKGAANVMNDYSSDGYLNRQQEEEEIDAVRKCFR